MTQPHTTPTTTAPRQINSAPDLGWTLTVIARHLLLFKALPRLDAAERILHALPIHDPRFVLTATEAMEHILARLD